MKYSNNTYIAGIIFTLLIAIVSMVMVCIPFIQSIHLSPLIIGVLLGVILSFLYHKNPSQYDKGVTFSAKKLLRFGIILYGFNVSLAEIGQVGIIGITCCIVVVIAILALGIWIGMKFFKLDRELAILVSGGSAICGAAAILALESSLRSEPYKGIVAVGTVVIFGLLGMFAYPIIYASGILGFTPTQEGFYIGLTLHEVANVVGAGAAISHEAANSALILKMIRVILLVPTLLIIPLLFSRTSQGTKRKLHIPWFALWFLGVVVLHSYLELSQNIIDVCKFVSVLCLTMAMSALGLQIDFKKFANTGGNAFKLACVLFVILSGGGFFMVYGLSHFGMM